jgi:ribosome modulation factor
VSCVFNRTICSPFPVGGKELMDAETTQAHPSEYGGANDSADPFAEGYEARMAGRSDTDNPYDLTDQEDAHLSWNDGWNEADECA